jgi:serine O-acetyltransferase
MYDTKLPSVFFFSHTVGCVLGKATYGNYLVFSQGCTVGTHHGQYPILEDGVALAAYASVIGRCVIGARASIGSNTAVFQRDIPPDTSVFRDTQGVLVTRPAQRPYAQQFINADVWK